MYESYNKDDKDFNAIVSRLKRDDIDLVDVGGPHLAPDARSGLKDVLISSDALADKEYASITGAATFFTLGRDLRKKPTTAAIVNKFRSGNIDPEGYTLYTFAAGRSGRKPQPNSAPRSEEGDGHRLKRAPGTR